MRDETEIQKVADKAASAAGKPSECFGMSYEEGVRDALDWVLDEDVEDDPV